MRPRLFLCAIVTFAVGPGGCSADKAFAKDQWWSLTQLVRPGIPLVKDKSWIRSPIDAYVLASLEANGLQPAPPADKRVLIRRLTHDLIGLPPTPVEVHAFLSDDSPQAYERLVDRLLASPHTASAGRGTGSTSFITAIPMVTTRINAGTMPGRTATTSSAPLTVTGHTPGLSRNRSLAMCSIRMMQTASSPPASLPLVLGILSAMSSCAW
jgi:Protein of unknown function (DUF1549)